MDRESRAMLERYFRVQDWRKRDSWDESIEGCWLGIVVLGRLSKIDVLVDINAGFHERKAALS